MLLPGPIEGNHLSSRTLPCDPIFKLPGLMIQALDFLKRTIGLMCRQAGLPNVRQIELIRRGAGKIARCALADGRAIPSHYLSPERVAAPTRTRKDIDHSAK